MRENVKSPLCCGGSNFIHGRLTLGQITASEQKYFTRNVTCSAKPEVQS